MGNLSTHNGFKPNPKLQQMDYLLSLYYELKGMTYYNDGMGRFSEWCIDNGLNIDKISKQLKKLPEQCILTQFDSDFPTSNNIDSNDTQNEIFQVIRYCWQLPNQFYQNIIQKKESIPNTYILGAIIEKQQLILHGYFRLQSIVILNDIINICGLYYIINRQSLCINIKPTWWKPRSVKHDIALCELAYKCVKNNEHFIAYQAISMIINNYDYHNHSSQTQARLYCYRGLVSADWKSLNDAENDMKLASELHSNCYYIHHYVKILFKKGDYNAALEHCLHAIKLDRTNVRSHNWCGLIYKKLNDWDNALGHYLECVELEPNKVKYIFSCADIYSKLNDYYYTKKYCSKAINFDPNNSEYHFHAAQLLEHFKNPTDADKYYLIAIHHTLNCKPKYRFHYGSFLKKQKKYKLALHQFNLAGDSRCVLECARICEKLKDYNKARDYYLKAIEMANPPRPGFICYYADFLQSEGKYEQALQQYRIAIQLAKNHINEKQVCGMFLTAQADCYVGLGDFINANKYYLKAIESNPKYKIQYAKFLYLQAEYENALCECLQVADLEQQQCNQELVTLWLAFCYEKLKDYNNATKCYIKAISFDKTDAKYYALYAKYLCKTLNDLETAQKYFVKAIELDSKDARLCYSYGVCLRDYYRNYKEAEIYYLKCLELGEKRCNGSYGYLLYLMGEYKKSLKYLQIGLLNVESDSYWTHYYFAVLNHKLGNKDQSNVSMKKALQSFAKILYKSEMEEAINSVNFMKNSDIQSAEYHEKFAQLLRKTFKTRLCK